MATSAHFLKNQKVFGDNPNQDIFQGEVLRTKGMSYLLPHFVRKSMAKNERGAHIFS